MEVDLMMMGKLSKRGLDFKGAKKKSDGTPMDKKGTSRAEEIKKKRIEQIRAKYEKK